MPRRQIDIGIADYKDFTSRRTIGGLTTSELSIAPIPHRYLAARFVGTRRYTLAAQIDLGCALHTPGTFIRCTAARHAREHSSERRRTPNSHASKEADM